MGISSYFLPSSSSSLPSSIGGENVAGMNLK